MKEREKLDDDILKITMVIHKQFPELSKYIAEMPVHVSYTSGSTISIENLKDYYNSLRELLERYASEHEHGKDLPQNI